MIKVIKVFSTKKNNVIGCDIEINGVTIYGCFISELKDKEGNTFYRLNYPSYKANNGKYYSHCYKKLDEKESFGIWSDCKKMLEA